MKTDQYAIGVLDSGVGGLTVVKEVMRQLPKETIYYFGDTLRCPYGPRSTAEVYEFTEEIINYLLQYPLKAILIACNTATAAALAKIKTKLPIPVLGVIEPGARAAIKVSKQNRIGIIGTQGTIRSRAYETALLKINPDLQVYSLACPKFVPIVEKGLHHTPAAEQVVDETLQPLTKLELDTLILGCTHYPLLNQYISKVMGERVATISSAEETAVELSTILQHQNLLAEFQQKPHRFFTTGSQEMFSQIAEEWLGVKIHVEKVTLSSLRQVTS